MKLRIDYSKCVDCGQCINACPQLADNKSMNIMNCDNCGKCVLVCPQNAFQNADGVFLINPEKCNNCGECVAVCDKKAVVQQDFFPSKCDLCLNFEKPKCIEACPYDAISLELSSSEKNKMKELVGWRKTGKESCYSAGVKEPSYEEIVFSESIIKELRMHPEFSDVAIEEIFEQKCADSRLVIDDDQRESIISFIKSETRGFSVLDCFLKDGDLEEISVINCSKPVYVYHKTRGWLESDVVIYSEGKINDLINRIGRELGRRVTMQKPRINANIKLGRLHAAISPIAVSGSCITIRKFNVLPFTPKELVSNGTVSAEAMAFLSMAVQCDVNVLICGNTGSGKTSTLNTLFSFIPESERIVVIEETPEIMLMHKHSIRLSVTENTAMHDLVEDTLRMRPDRIIVGEVRSPEEAKALINTMLAGQGKSSFATFHAQSSEEALLRMVNLGVAPFDLYALDLIIVQRRWTDLSRKKDLRRVTEISCIKKNYLGKPEIEKIFEYDSKKDTLAPVKTGNRMNDKIRDCFKVNEKQLDKMLKKVSEEYAV